MFQDYLIAVGGLLLVVSLIWLVAAIIIKLVKSG
jgi:hypothetical protein